MKIGIVGGGFMGVCLAVKLSKMGHEVSLFENDEQLGGLATYYRYDDFFWDKFYHVILPGDKYLLSFLEDLELKDNLRRRKTYTGVYVDKKFYSVSNSKEFLLFPPLNLIQKMRLAFTILYASRIKDWKSLENTTVGDWLTKVGGKATYEKFWKPLLLAKLGNSYKRVSAVFIWTYIKRLFEARDSGGSSKEESMAYVEGGYKTVFDAAEQFLLDRGATIRTATRVDRISAGEGTGITLTYENRTEQFDKLIATTPTNIIQKIIDPGLLQIDGQTKGEVEYLGVVCMILLTKEALTPYYVLNIADEQIPFTGVIGMSTLVDLRETGDLYMTYLPKYVLSTDPFLQKSDEEIHVDFMKGLSALYPDFDMGLIAKSYIHRAIKVQPLQVLNYSQLIPKVDTKHPDLFVLNTSQFVNDTLNNNSVARHVESFLEDHQAIFQQKREEVLA